MKLISCVIGLVLFLLPWSPLVSDEVAPVPALSKKLRLKVLLDPQVLLSPDRPSCSTYHKGALVHQQSNLLGLYTFELPVAYRASELRVSCSHPHFEDSGGELGAALLIQDTYFRGLYVGFTRPRLIQNANVQRTDSIVSRVQFQAKLPAPTFSDVQIPAAGAFKKLSFGGLKVPFLEGSDFEGRPEVPVATPLIALPRGASIQSISVVASGSSLYKNVRLVPVPAPRPEAPDYVDTKGVGFDPLVYNGPRITLGAKLYEQPIAAGDFRLVKVALYLVDYDSATQELSIPKSVDVTVQFQNSSACYRVAGAARDKVENAFQKYAPDLVQKAINFRDVSATPSCPRPSTPVVLRSAAAVPSADYVILSHSSFTAAAEQLAQHKRDLGWYTTVLTSDDRELEALKAQIQELQPKWLLVLGDAEFVGTYYHNREPHIINRFDGSFAAGDTYFAQGYSDRLNPGNFSIGRLPVDTPEEATRLVNRIIDYERSPSLDLAFYQNPMWLANVPYASDLESFYRNTATHFGFVPQRFYYQGGQVIPDDLANIPRVNWDANATLINNQLNSTSAAIVLHRGHANWYGWQAPQYSAADIGALSKSATRSPFVLSINCSSGFFDNETAAALAVPPPDDFSDPTPYIDADPTAITFAEKFIRHSTGAIGVIADTRQSDTQLNKTLAEGAIRSIYGNSNSPVNPFLQGRLGQILLASKAQVVAGHTSIKEVGTQLLIYNLLGDPGVYLHKQRPYEVRKLVFDRSTMQGELEIFDSECGECLLPEADRSGLMVSARRLHGDRSILARVLPSSVDGRRYTFDFSGNDWTADDIQISVAGPTLKPDFLQSLKPRPNLSVRLSAEPAVFKEGLNPGSRITVTVTNTGPVLAGGTLQYSTQGYMVDLLLSRDRVLPQGWAVFNPNFFEDVLIRGGRASNTANVLPGGSQTFVFQDIEIPRGARGSFCLGTTVDPGRVIVEEREDDNSACVEINVTAP